MHAMGREFRIIQDHFAARSDETLSQNNDIQLGIGDDCAIVRALPEGFEQLISVDTSLAGRHFPQDAPPNLIASRALNVSLSDLAAMGAEPCWFTLALTLPELEDNWLKEFSAGLFDAAQSAGVALVGGDTTKGTLSISVQVAGKVPSGKGLLRSGAKAGDHIYVSGTLGDAGAGLASYLAKGYDATSAIQQAYLEPQPRLALGQQLVSVASSCIDVSDGLLADLSHILAASNVGAELDLNLLPLSDSMQAFDQAQALDYALTAGDDYELCFTSAMTRDKLKALGVDDVTCIGTITNTGALALRNIPQGMEVEVKGYDHFSE